MTAGNGSTPFFSIVLPTYNRAHMLPSALETVRRQTFTDYEALIVDDGSTDDTPAMIQEWLRDTRLKYKRLEKNIGNMHCRNLALEMASGTWITNIDSDDFWLPRRLENFARHAQEHPRHGFVFSNSYYHRFGRIIDRAFAPDRPIQEGRVPGHYAVAMEFLPYLTTSLAIPRAHYQKYGHYRKDIVILDNELYARMLADGVEVGVIREPLAVRRIHEGQVTHKWIEEYPEAVEALKVSGASPEVLEAEREKLVYEVANYLIRAIEPAKAREFMLKELGNKARASPLYRQALLPAWLLAAAKTGRRWWLTARHHPFFASPELLEVYALIDPLIARERRPGSAA